MLHVNSLGWSAVSRPAEALRSRWLRSIAACELGQLNCDVLYDEGVVNATFPEWHPVRGEHLLTLVESLYLNGRFQQALEVAVRAMVLLALCLFFARFNLIDCAWVSGVGARIRWSFITSVCHCHE